MALHNARLGRSGGVARGRSFDQVFAESYAAAPIGKATPEQMRMALLTAEQIRVNRQDGVVELYGNRYWSEDLSRHHGARVTVRFDPDNLHSEIYLYDQAGRFLTAAQLIADVGFDDVEGAKATKKRLTDARRKRREGLEAEQLLDAAELAAMQPSIVDLPLPQPAVLRPVKHRGNAAVALQPTAPMLPTKGSNILKLFGRLKPED